jgi:hypothetical protein
MTHRFSSFRFSAMLFENESRALGDVNFPDFHFFSNPGCSCMLVALLYRLHTSTVLLVFF